jgi:hypothetical protein
MLSRDVRFIHPHGKLRIAPDDVLAFVQDEAPAAPHQPEPAGGPRAIFPLSRSQIDGIGDEGIAGSEVRPNEPRSLGIVGQRATKFRDGHRQVRFFDPRVRPHLLEQLLLADDVRPLLQQHAEHGECLPGQRNRLVVAAELPGAGIEGEARELNSHRPV